MEVAEIYTTVLERKKFLKGLIRAALVDGIVVDEERTYVINAAIGLGLGQADVDELTAALGFDLNDSKVREYFMVDFDTKAKKIFLLEEIIQLSNIDEEYADAEKENVRIMAKEMGLAESTVETIEAWVADGIAWRKKGETLLQLEG